jgi:hypothetical protein
MSNTVNPAGSPQITVQRTTPFERFEEATRHLLQVPKREVEKAELRAKKEREAKRANKPK